ncbi:hypothetical protein D9619_013563 [Psilocybe cf. subviscida]|uniref:Uncharacterized protein n=1 Tax=Psilocybe cf. subviscida TaxID=2480587 RepID=A0A8H5EQ74_9AGAR|nr:hypothetical protein D9619_013563 [Psilocybe cf. subviscida]
MPRGFGGFICEVASKHLEVPSRPMASCCNQTLPRVDAAVAHSHDLESVYPDEAPAPPLSAARDCQLGRHLRPTLPQSIIIWRRLSLLITQLLPAVCAAIPSALCARRPPSLPIPVTHLRPSGPTRTPRLQIHPGEAQCVANS